MDREKKKTSKKAKPKAARGPAAGPSKGKAPHPARRKLQEPPLQELHRLARELGIKGQSRMKPPELLQAIAKARQPAKPAPAPPARKPALEKPEPVVPQPPSEIPIVLIPEVLEAEAPPAKPAAEAEADIRPLADTKPLERKVETKKAPPRSASEKAEKAEKGCRATLLPLSPRRIFAYWDCDPEAVEGARRQIEDPEAVLVLRVKDVTAIEFDEQRDFGAFEVPVHGPSGNYYLNQLFPGRSYQAAIGLRSGSGQLQVLATAAIAETPKEGDAAHVEVKAVPVRGAGRGRWKPRPQTLAAPAPEPAAALPEAAAERKAAAEAFSWIAGEPVLEEGMEQFPLAPEQPAHRLLGFEERRAQPGPEPSRWVAPGEPVASAPERIVAAALVGGATLGDNGTGDSGNGGAPGSGPVHTAATGVLEGPAAAPSAAAPPLESRHYRPEAPWAPVSPPAPAQLPGTAPRSEVVAPSPLERKIELGVGLSSAGIVEAGRQPGPGGGLPSSVSVAPGVIPASPPGLGLLPLVEGVPQPPPSEAESYPGPKVLLELHAEVIVYGRCSDPQTAVFVEGQRIPVRHDGTFDLRFALAHSPRR
ncbi:MAG: DUF4912 domain-containing protein [Planctomycetes bacterium]|nr:DUF4912 domain-containing protein [Planctomycetota bacterium]